MKGGPSEGPAHAGGAGETDQTSPVNGPLPAAPPATNPGYRGPWPEDDSRDQIKCCRRGRSALRNWSYAYMSPVLARGAEVHRSAAERKKKMRSSRLLPWRRRRRDGDGNYEDSCDSCGENGSNGEPSSPSRPKQAQQLTVADLYAAPKSMRASALRPLFNVYYADANGRLLRTLWRLARPSFLPAGFCQLITVLAQVAVPMFVWQLLRILEANPNANVFGEAVPYVFLILLADVANAYGTHRQRFLAMKSGVTIRIAMIGAIYERVLRLTPAGRSGLTTGAVTNLFAIDAQKVFEVTAEGHLLWSAPLSMLLVAVMLVVVVGPSMAVGIALLVLFVPIVQVISNRMMEIRKQRVRVTDRRVEIVNAMLQGIKVTKLNSYEGKYIERIKGVRDEELGLLRRELYVWSLVMAVQFISPVVASAGAFAAYVLAGNILTTADAFTALLLFNALRFPINYASRLVGKAAQARESARRISVFMRRETREGFAGEQECKSVGADATHSSKGGDMLLRHGTESTLQASNGESRHDKVGSLRSSASPAVIEDESEPSHIDDAENDVVSPLPSENLVGYGGKAWARLPTSNAPATSTPTCSNGHAKDLDPLLVIKNGTFRTGDTLNATWEETGSDAESTPHSGHESGFTVSGVSMSVNPGEILAVVGPVGSGKSTIVNAIIGEISASPSTVLEARGNVAYASQVPFILNATVKENILFGNSYDAKRYNLVLNACCLRTDLDQLSAGDMTEIGERGVTLSGGQKQRVSLARAVYSRPDVVLFDDPLSALDAGTARKVFDRLFGMAHANLLSTTAVVLVTHASHFLNRVDRIMVVVEGRVPFYGTWNELAATSEQWEREEFAVAPMERRHDKKARVAIESILNAVQENGNSDDNERQLGNKFNCSNLQHTEMDAFRDAMHQSTGGGVAEMKLMTGETREHGLTQAWTWTLWFRHAGGILFTLGLLILFVSEKAFYFGTELWISVWTDAAEEPTSFWGFDLPSQTEGLSAQYQYLKVYLILLALGFVCAYFRTVWIVSGGVRCSRALYAAMTKSVLLSPMVYFETTPMGRLLNRFTYDAEILDVTLVWSMSMLLIATSWFVTSLIVMVVILPWMLLVLMPVSLCYIFIQTHYRKSGADLQRLDALSRSPLQTMLAEAIEGSSTIRTFRKEPTFVHRFQGLADRSTSAQMNFLGAQRWLGVRIELLGAGIVFCASLLVIIFNGFFGLGAGLVALLIRWSAGFTISLSFLLDNAAEAEGAVTAIERIHRMAELPAEPNFDRKEPPLDASWPQKGELEFKDVRMRYRPLLPLSLDGLSFRVEAGEHCGVVGRTGAGKSTLLTALFRLVEIESGAISVDGVDLSTIGLSDIRGRQHDGISIIPQDPFLFAGTLRECLDPFGTSKDDDLLDALRSVRMLPTNRSEEYLESRVEEGGTNYSVGERSLLVLARAMLAKPRLLLMDEATASIDSETDSFIQRMLRTRFAGTTLLTIAHRLESIMDYDKILVMQEGKAAEFGTPSDLIDDGGVFAELVNATGEGAAALVAMAREKQEQKKRSSAFEDGSG